MIVLFAIELKHKFGSDVDDFAHEIDDLIEAFCDVQRRMRAGEDVSGVDAKMLENIASVDFDNFEMAPVHRDDGTMFIVFR